MRKSIISTLFILSFLFGLVSCSNQLKAKTNVTMNFDVQSFYNEVAARDVIDENLESVLEVQLYVDNKLFNTKSQTFDKSKKTITMEFKEIPLISTVYAEAWITLGKITTYYGKSAEVIVSSDNTELQLTLKKQTEVKGDPTVIEEMENYDISAQFFVQKKNASGNPINEYELYKSVPISSEHSFEEIIQDESLQEYQDFMAIHSWTTYELMIKGYDLRENVDPNYRESDIEVVFESGKYYVNFYFNFIGELTKHQLFQGSANGTIYYLDLYRDIYNIKNQNNETISMGMSDYYKDNDIVSFFEFLYKNDDKICFPNYFYLDGLYNEEYAANYTQMINWSSSTTSFTIKYYSESEPLQITFTIPEGFSLEDFFNSEDPYNNIVPESNIIWTAYVQNRDLDGNPIQDSYSIYDEFYIDYADISALNLTDYYDINDLPDFRATYWWICYELAGNGYDMADGKDFIAEKQGDKLNISSYYDIAQTVNEPWHYKELQGSSGGNTYTLKLYDAGIGFIYNDSGKPVYCYSCSKKANDNEHIIFVQTWYCKDKRIKFSPIWFRNGQFLFDSVESIFDLDGVEQITWTQGNNFTITCKDGTNDLPITFATPADFNVFEFFKDDGDEGGSININLTDPNTNLLTITATPSKDFCMYAGSINLGAILKANNTNLSTDPNVIWDAKLLYGGADINEYDTYYEIKKNDNKTCVSILNTLVVSGYYQLYVIAIYNGITTSQMFDIYVSGEEYHEYNVEDPNFDNLFASDASSIIHNATLVFTGDLTSSSPTTEERFRNILQEISSIGTELNVDMSDLSGVTEMPDYSYIYAPKLKTVKFPNSLTKLKTQSFGYNTNNIISVYIPTTIQDIQGGAFIGCTSLENVIFKGEPVSGVSFAYANGAIIKTEDNYLTNTSTKTLVTVIPNVKNTINFANDFSDVDSIGEAAFKNSSISSITGFGTIKTIPKDAFYECKSLTSVNLEGIETVGETAFCSCTALTTLTNYESLKTVGVAGFRNCNISQFTIYTDEMTLETNAFASAIDTLTIDIEITADNYDTIKTNYITPTYGTKHIIFNKSAVIPDLTSSTFRLCQSNQNPTANLPASTIQLNDAFLYSYIGSLQSIEFKGGNSSIGKNQFINYKKLTQIITNGNVTSIGDFAFYGCLLLESVNLNGVSYVGTCAFENCTKLSNLTLGNTVKQIGQRAFYKANGLSGKELTIPLSTFALGACSFYVSSETQPTITITHANSPQTETWYSVVWPTTVDNYWTLYVMIPSIETCPDFPDSSSYVTKLEGDALNDLDSTIQTSVTSSSNEVSYLRAIGSGD
ncbi:MAG: leucine-rich repeat protein [Treponema sp.]|nr:leucine-rich repeat protein [Treponema sp.]